MSSTVTASARLFTAANTEYFNLANASLGSLAPGDTDFSGYVWVKHTSFGASNDGLICLGDIGTGGQESWAIYWNQALNRYRFLISSTGSSGGRTILTADTFGAPSTATWYRVCYRYTASADTMEIKVDTTSSEGAWDTASHAGGAYNGTTQLLQVGRIIVTGSPTYFNGAMATWAHWTEAASNAKFTSTYNAGAGKLYKDFTASELTNMYVEYDFVETSGNGLNATATASKTLVDNNTVTSAAGKVTYTAEDASQFTAANTEYLSCNSNSTLQTGDIDFSVVGWFYLDTMPASLQILIEKWDSNPGAEYAFFVDGTNSRIQFYVNNAVGSIVSASSLRTGAWFFGVATHDATNNLLGISLNGAAKTTGAYSSGITASNSPVWIGANKYGAPPSSMLNGRGTGFGFWKKVLSDAEIAQLYNRGFGLDYSDLDAGLLTSLISYWELTEASGSRADSHGTNTLTDNNTVTGNPGVVYDAPAVITFKPHMLLLGVG